MQQHYFNGPGRECQTCGYGLELGNHFIEDVQPKERVRQSACLECNAPIQFGNSYCKPCARIVWGRA